MPTNLYGPNDNFHLENSYVLPAMVRKIHLAKCLNEGDWEAVRLDLDKRLIEKVDGSASEEAIRNCHINIGTGKELTSPNCRN